MEQKLMEQKSSEGVIEVSPSEDSGPTTEKGRRFVFTYFPKDDENLWDSVNMKYMYYGDETCPTTGKKHHQGWFITHNPRSERALCKLYKCYIRIQRGSYKHNWKYCSKDGKIHEFGEQPKQGARNDLTSIKDEIINNQTTVEDIIIERPNMYHSYGRTLEKIEEISLRKKFRMWEMDVRWYYGNTGVGKSKYLWEGYDPDKVYYWRDDGGWQDEYRGQEIVVIDEFRGDTMTYKQLLRLTDRYPYGLRRRGKTEYPFLAKKIIITSCSLPSEIFKNLSQNDSLAQLKRRIKIFYISQLGDEPEEKPLLI